MTSRFDIDWTISTRCIEFEPAYRSVGIRDIGADP